MSERELVGHIRSWRNATAKWTTKEFRVPLNEGERITFDAAQGAVVVRDDAGSALVGVRGVTEFWIEQEGREIVWTCRDEIAATVDL